MNFKDDVICNFCKRFILDPISLPCGCWICNEHILQKEKNIKCLNCDEEFPKTKRFKSNELVKKIINSDSHLTEQQKSVKVEVSKMLADFDALIEEFTSNKSYFEINIDKQFDDIRNKIDLQREELKNKIDEIALKMIGQTKEREENLRKNLNQVESNILNTGVKEVGRQLFEEFRDPNMILENIKITLEKQDSKISQIKASINDFKFRLDQSKAFYFKPNLSNENNIFGELNHEIANKLISFSSDKTIKIWDLGTFECLKTLNGHSDRIWRIESLSNNQILSCSKDKTIKLWEIDTGLCLKTFNNHYGFSSLKLLTDKTFASGSYKEIKIWNIDDGRCIKTLNDHISWVKDLLLLPNQSLISCSQDNTIKIWNVDQGICTKTLIGHTDAVLCMILLNNGSLISGSKEIKIWDLESGNCVTTLIGHNGWIWSLQLKPSGELISASSDKTIKIWDLETCTCIKTLIGHNDGVSCIRTYQNNHLISSSADKTIKLWNLETETCIKTLNGHTNVVDCLKID